MPSAIPQRGVRLEDELYDKACYIAKLENRSFNQQVVYIIRRFIDEYESQHGKIVIPEEDE